MKLLKKLMVVLVAVLMVISLTSRVNAEEPTKGTITVTNATKGITYTAYKVFDASYSPDDHSKVSYTVPASNKDKVDTTLFEVSTNPDSAGNYTVSKKSDAKDSDIIAWIKNNYNKFGGAPITGEFDDTNSTVTFSNLDFGYYYITSSLGSVVTIDTTNPSAEVLDKNDSTPETPEKLIVGEGDTDFDQGKDSNEAGVGSIEKFEVTFDAVNWITSTADGKTTTTQATVWNFSDTPIGLDIDATTVRVFVTDAGTEKEITNTIKNKAKSEAGVLTFNIPWVDEHGNSLYGPEIASGTETQTAAIPVRVTYNATVTAAAATEVAPNTIEVKYNNETSIGTDSTNTYTYKFKLDKAKADYSDLLGAKFQLYSGSKIAVDATPLSFTIVGGKYQLDPNGTVTEIDLTTVASAEIIGLDKATYTLRETVVPKGYNPAADQVVADTALKRVDQEITDAAATITGDDGVVTVVNNQGAELPSTGGIGTTIFHIAGAALVLGAGILLISKKRMNNN